MFFPGGGGIMGGRLGQAPAGGAGGQQGILGSLMPWLRNRVPSPWAGGAPSQDPQKDVRQIASVTGVAPSQVPGPGANYDQLMEALKQLATSRKGNVPAGPQPSGFTPGLRGGLGFQTRMGV